MATQSTTVIPPPNDPDKYLAGNAVDRNFSTCMRTEAIGGNSPYNTVWWKVDLGGVYNIYSVNILFKNYDGYGNVFLLKNHHIWQLFHFFKTVVLFHPNHSIKRCKVRNCQSVHV